MITVFDFETTGKIERGIPAGHPRFPRAVSMGIVCLPVLADHELTAGTAIIRPEGFVIPADATRVHGVTTERALAEGKPAVDVISAMSKLFERSTVVVSHNIQFDGAIFESECEHLNFDNPMNRRWLLCTMLRGTSVCAIPGRHGDFKWPSLLELFVRLYGEDHPLFSRFFSDRDVHDPLDDTRIAALNYAKMELGSDDLAAYYVARGI